MGVHRPVRGCVGGIKKERLVGRLVGVLFEERDGVVADRVGIVVSLRMVLRIVDWSDVGVASTQRRRIVKTTRANDRTVELLEATLQRPIILGAVRADVPSDMPFAGHIAAIPCGAERLGDRNGPPPIELHHCE